MSTEQEKDELEQLMPPGLLELLRTCPIPRGELNQIADNLALSHNPPKVIILPPPPKEEPGK